MNNIKTLLAASAVLFVFGCASSESKPTHYWESTVSKSTYHQDNEVCGDMESKFDADSASFEVYRDCMISKGYTLRHY
jgi:hypothetical protein